MKKINPKSHTIFHYLGKNQERFYNLHTKEKYFDSIGFIKNSSHTKQIKINISQIQIVKVITNIYTMQNSLVNPRTCIGLYSTPF